MAEKLNIDHRIKGIERTVIKAIRNRRNIEPYEVYRSEIRSLLTDVLAEVKPTEWKPIVDMDDPTDVLEQESANLFNHFVKEFESNQQRLGL